MKLGTETGSLINHVMSREVAVASDGKPVVPLTGMPATILMWSDRIPATVISFDGKIIQVQEDHAVRTDGKGMSENQEYSYSENKNGTIFNFKRDKRGFWKEVMFNPETSRYNKACGGSGLRLGEREKYCDFSF